MGHLLRDADGHFLRDTSGHLMREAVRISMFDYGRQWTNTVYSVASSRATIASELISAFRYSIRAPEEPYFWDEWDFSGPAGIGWQFLEAEPSTQLATSWVSGWGYSRIACKVFHVPELTGKNLLGLELPQFFYLKSGGGTPRVGVATDSVDGPATSVYTDLFGEQSLDVYGGLFSAPIVIGEYVKVYFFIENHQPPTIAGQTHGFEWFPGDPLFFLM